MRKTKIICTIGPASESDEMLRKLMLSGMNAARLNFSHGSHAEHLKKIEKIKKLREELSMHVAILLDTKGPEIRTGKFALPEIELKDGQKFTLTTRDILGTAEICSVSYKELPKDLKAGDKVLIDDGLLQLTVDEVSGTDIVCTVENGGIVKDNKGINVPNVKINLPALTEKDIDDIRFGVENGVDFVAASFIRKAEDVRSIRQLLKELGGDDIMIISKIENKEGLDNIDEIIAESDGIMVARGDLGVEIPMQEVPVAQKSIIKKCNDKGIIVVTATQMLDSMMRNPRPTRAEVADVANAIFDGTDAIMLSGETASGKYPLESVCAMTQIAHATEDALDYHKMQLERAGEKDKSVTNAIAHATCTVAAGLGVSAILTPTASGHTAFMVARFRPQPPIIAPTYRESVARKLALCWGTYPAVIAKGEHQREVFQSAIEAGKKKDLLKDGDQIVITAGVPLLKHGNTNVMRIHVVGESLS